MLSRIYTAGLCGIDGMIITIECSTMKRMPVFDIVGLPDASVKESKDRIRSALRQRLGLRPAALCLAALCRRRYSGRADAEGQPLSRRAVARR